MLQSGDTLFLYTDGVTEAQDEKEERFEEERLSNCLSEKKDLPPKEISRNVIEAVQTFSAKVPQEDDITVLALKYTP
jgi:sigma-B regulation protein RsbU (phosphoserine phosphatase)